MSTKTSPVPVDIYTALPNILAPARSDGGAGCFLGWRWNAARKSDVEGTGGPSIGNTRFPLRATRRPSLSPDTHNRGFFLPSAALGLGGFSSRWHVQRCGRLSRRTNDCERCCRTACSVRMWLFEHLISHAALTHGFLSPSVSQKPK